MQQNVRKMIDNQNELNDIEVRAGELQNIAFNLKNNADQIRKEAARRNIRLMIAIGVVAVVLLTIIIVSVTNSE